jgi:hypothetical protein
VFFSKRCVGGTKFPKFGSLTLFHMNFPMDLTHPRLSNIMDTWERHEYVIMNLSSSLSVVYKIIDLLEDDILVLEFTRKV